MQLVGDGNYTKLLDSEGGLIKHSSYTIKKVLLRYPNFIRLRCGVAVDSNLIAEFREEGKQVWAVLRNKSEIKIPRRKVIDYDKGKIRE